MGAIAQGPRKKTGVTVRRLEAYNATIAFVQSTELETAPGSFGHMMQFEPLIPMENVKSATPMISVRE